MAEKLLMVLKKRKESGASMLEYALLAALIAAVCMVAVQNIGNTAKDKFNSIQATMAA